MTASATKATLESKLPKGGGITPSLASVMLENLGSEHVGICVFEVASRTEKAPDADAEPSVKLRVLDIELARDNDEAEYLRTILRGLYRLRTNAGTLDENADNDEEIVGSAEATLGGLLAAAAEANGWIVTETTHGPLIDIPGTDVRDAGEYLARAVNIVVDAGVAALATVTRKLRVSAELATTILNVLQERGVVGEPDELHNRPVLINRDQVDAILAELKEPQPDDEVEIEDDDDEDEDDDVTLENAEIVEA